MHSDRILTLSVLLGGNDRLKSAKSGVTNTETILSRFLAADTLFYWRMEIRGKLKTYEG